MTLSKILFFVYVYLFANNTTVHAMDIQAEEKPILFADHEQHPTRVHSDRRGSLLAEDLLLKMHKGGDAAISEVQNLLERGADANYHENRGFALIHLTISNGKQPKLLNLLLEHGASLRSKIIRTRETDQCGKINCSWIRIDYITQYIPLGSTPFHLLDYCYDAEKRNSNTLLYHALFYGIRQRKFTQNSYSDVTLAPKDFVEMLAAAHEPTRCASRHVLGVRIHKLKKILRIKNKLQETQQTISVDALDTDLPFFFAALEARAIKKLDKENLYKRAHDAMEEHAPSSCVIC